MSLRRCECAGQPISGGLLGKNPLIGHYLYPIFVPLFQTDGTPNSIPKGTTIDQTYIEGKFNNTDNNLRWRMFPRMSSLAAAPTVSDTEDIDGIAKNLGSETKQPITYDHIGAVGPNFLKAAYDSQDCTSLGILWVTNKMHLVGEGDGEGNLLPIAIEDDTIMAQIQASLEGTSQKVSVNLVYGELVDEACLDYIDECTIEYNPKYWFAKAPIEVIPVEVSNSSQTTIVMDFGAANSGYGEKKPVTGLVVADLSYDNGTTDETVYNLDTSLSVALTSLTADVAKPGRYTILMGVAQTAADRIRVQLSKDGYSMYYVDVTLS